MFIDLFSGLLYSAVFLLSGAGHFLYKPIKTKKEK